MTIVLRRPRSLLRSLILLAGIVATGGAAFAQSAACQRYRAELASLGQGGSQAAAAAQRQRAEISRMMGYFRSIGCDRDPYNFFGSPPPECGAIAQRIRTMEANYASIVAHADPYGDVEGRRRQLLAAIEQACQPREATDGPRGLFESLFGGQIRRRPEIDEGLTDSGQVDPGQDAERPRRALGGRKVVCVRACDGFFFPLDTLPDGQDSADDLCQALCPNAQASAFYMPPGGDIENAVSAGGRPYTQLASASKYKKSFDASCSCKKEGDSWSEALARAEEMIARRRGDIVVTAQKSEELSRPKVEAPAPPRGKEKPKRGEKAAASAPPAPPPGEASASRPEVDGGESAPTAGNESAGIGPQVIEGPRVVGRGDGQRREVTSEGGARRTVRSLPVPGEARTP